MRIKINSACNVCCEEHSKSKRLNEPEITVPSLRLRLSIGQARLLADQILQAADFAASLGDLADEPDETARLATISKAIAARES